MQLGMIGLGRMGGNIVRRLMQAGHHCVVYDKSAEAVQGLAGEGAAPSRDLADFVRQLDKPRAVWVMLPAGAITHATIVELADEIGEVPARCRPLLRQTVHGVGALVVDDAVMAGMHQSPHDVAAHPAEADHPELHQVSPVDSGAVRPSRRAPPGRSSG